MSHISVINEAVNATWVSNHYNGILRTAGDPEDLTTEALVNLETEDLQVIETNGTEPDIEITTISFVGDESPTPNSTAGQFKV